jgi:hypothetical protein
LSTYLQELMMQKQWTLTTKNGETVEGLSNEDAVHAIYSIMAGTNPSTGRSDDTHEYELEVAFAA